MKEMKGALQVWFSKAGRVVVSSGCGLGSALLALEFGITFDHGHTPAVTLAEQ